MKVLLLSPDSPDCTTIAEWLRSRGYTVEAVSTASEAMEVVGAKAPRFALVDLAGRTEAMKFLRSLVTDQHAIWVVAIADRRHPAATAEALRLGAVDIVPRPVREPDVIASLGNAREFAGLAARPAPAAPEYPPVDGVLTLSPRMREVYEMARRVAPSRCPVLLIGERGTGRETIARMVHHHSSLSDRPFWKIPAGAAAPSELSEIPAEGDGTIFVEELSEVDADVQSRILRIVSNEPGPDAILERRGFRVLAAVQPNVETLIERRVVQRALVATLSVLTLELPTLRERPQDIPALAAHFLKEACHRNGVVPKSFSRSALALLASLPWRGNAGELKGLVERLAVLVPRGVILQEDVLQHVRFGDVQAIGRASGSLRDARRKFEREYITAVLQKHQWRMEGAAGELGIERTNLYRKIKQLGITRSDRHK